MAVNFDSVIGKPPLVVAQEVSSPAAARSGYDNKVFSLGQVESVPSTLEQFQAATKAFGEALRDLPPQHKAEVRVIYKAVGPWVERERAAGRKADKLATFVGRVMEYTNESMESIEETDPHLTKRRQEYEKLNKAFHKGADLIDAYYRYVKDKSIP